MKRSRNEPFSVNSIIMANLAFLSLLFFQFVMPPDYEEGLEKTLPKVVDRTGIICVMPPPNRSRINIKVNSNEELLIEGRPGQVNELYGIARMFYTNPENSDKYPRFNVFNMKEVKLKVKKWEQSLREATSETPEHKAAQAILQQWQIRLLTLEAIGKDSYREINRLAIIDIDLDKEVTYGKTIEILSELRAARNDLRDEYSNMYFGKDFNELDPKKGKNRIIAIKTLVPARELKSEIYYR